MDFFRKNFNSILIIAYRDIRKFLSDKARIVATFIFPVVFIGILGSSSQSNLGEAAGFNFLTFTFTGVLAQTLFQSAASGIISLIEDRDNDFSQEMFVSPTSRYAILFGKIIGESSVAIVQAIGILIFIPILQIPFTLNQILLSIPVMIVACLFGSSFGILVMSNLSNQRAANQVFPFLILPQFFLAGIFTPIRDLPIVLEILSRMAPLTYVVDLMRAVTYQGLPEYDKVVLFPVWLNLLVIFSMFIVFLVVGTWLFVRNERNR